MRIVTAEVGNLPECAQRSNALKGHRVQCTDQLDTAVTEVKDRSRRSLPFCPVDQLPGLLKKQHSLLLLPHKAQGQECVVR